MKKLLVILLVFSGTSLSQLMGPGDERSGRGERPDFVLFEALTLTSKDTSLARADVLYRINSDFFVPVKNPDPTFQWEFKRRGEILIELIDSTGVSRAREINRIEIGTETSEEKSTTKNWYQGMVSFSIPPGSYKLVVEVDDLESERKFIDRNTQIRARKFGSVPLETASPLLAQWEDSSSIRGTLIPQNFGGNMLFGRRSALYLELVSREPFNSPVRVEYSIATMPGPDENSEVLLKDTLLQVPTLRDAILIQKRQGKPVAYSIETGAAQNVAGILIPFHSEKLPLRSFECTVTIHCGTLETVVKTPLRMVWPEMPFSLRNVEFALDALRYITTERQLDSLKRGSFRQQRDNLETFWKAQDPSPQTAYNELMVQYYQRVDHAFQEFGTLREPDGSKSDRGRIHILFGPPTRVDRSLSATAGFQEIWLYEGLRKKFVFLDETKSGNYVLISTQTL